MIQNASFHWLLLMGFFYIIGALIYAFRFPERCFPGRCDYFVRFKIFFVILFFLVSFSPIFPLIC